MAAYKPDVDLLCMIGILFCRAIIVGEKSSLYQAKEEGLREECGG
jgi:hypothetical protein